MRIHPKKVKFKGSLSGYYEQTLKIGTGMLDGGT